ncbi:G-type lectin S-receptor-like serine/threonine-protein kinase At2g19130 [Aegilops tauschii subsp. strangulata]|uniref:non-specific serine/threonine protein kinase n=1 Tax=Aegilops tauschii TaxID=37682 RepID=N1QTC0_AEGTA
MAPLIFLLLLSQILVCIAVDIINSTSLLSGTTQRIVSQGKKFTLGFYSPTQGNTTSSSSSNSYYIAIWYSDILSVTTATSDLPVSDPARAALAMGSDGNLVLFDHSRNMELWSTNWRSIDHPTNTWLPGGKLGLNKITGVSQRLVPWKNMADPSPGLFTLELDPNGTPQFFIRWNLSITYWSSGPWNGHNFTLAPEMTIGLTFDIPFINNDTEGYLFYSLSDVGGQIKHLSWMDSSQQWMLVWAQPPIQCEVYALCGAAATSMP